MDFTLSAYKQLISTLRSQGYFFQTFEEYIQNSRKKVVILRHDVDRKPENALVIAKIEKDAGIMNRGTSLNNQMTFLNPLTVKTNGVTS